jgi:hypothetical protein
VSPFHYLKMETDPVSETLFSIYLEFLTMDRVHKPADSECYSPWPEAFEFYEKSDLVVRRRDSNISAPKYFRSVISTPSYSVFDDWFSFLNSFIISVILRYLKISRKELIILAPHYSPARSDMLCARKRDQFDAGVTVWNQCLSRAFWDIATCSR